jgi:hypothetical protein
MNALRRLPLELILVIGIPLCTVVAGIITVVIATQNSYEPLTQHGSGRFAGLSAEEESNRK